MLHGGCGTCVVKFPSRTSQLRWVIGHVLIECMVCQHGALTDRVDQNGWQIEPRRRTLEIEKRGSEFVSIAMCRKPDRLRERSKRPMQNRFLRAAKHVRVMNDSSTRANVVSRVARECSPGRAGQSIIHSSPMVDCNGSIFQISDCSVERVSDGGLFSCFVVDND